MMSCQIADMTVYQLGRKTDGIRSDCGQSALVDLSGTFIRNPHLVAK